MRQAVRPGDFSLLPLLTIDHDYRLLHYSIRYSLSFETSDL